MEDHAEVVGAQHRFQGVSYRGVPWSLEHLDAFALRLDPGLGFAIDVVVLFSCHCFSISLKRDGRHPSAIPRDHLYIGERETRVLCPERYDLSRKYFPRLITELPTRQIRVAAEQRQNFFTTELIDEAGGKAHYAVFFEPEKDGRRSKRVLLRIQSAYRVDTLSHRQTKAGKVSFYNLLKAVYNNRRIKG